MDEKRSLRVLFFVAVASKGSGEAIEVQVLGANLNRRLVEIQRDAFLRSNIEWSCEIQPIEVCVWPKCKPRTIAEGEQIVETGEKIMNGGDKVGSPVSKEKTIS